MFSPTLVKFGRKIAKTLRDYNQAYAFVETMERNGEPKSRVVNYVLRYPWHIPNWVENQTYIPHNQTEILKERMNSARKSGTIIETERLPPGLKPYEEDQGKAHRIKITRKPLSSDN